MMKKKIISIIFVIIMLIGIIITLSGCGEKKTKLLVDDCINYMETKYDESFTYLEPGKNQTTRTMTLYVKSDNFPDSRIFVTEELIDGTKYFHDNYVAVKYKNDTIHLFTKLSKDVFGDCRIIYCVDDGMFLSDDFDSNTSFLEYISNAKSRISMTILLPPEHTDLNKEEELNRMYSALCENNFICTFNVYYTNNRHNYEEIQMDEMWLTRDWFTANGQITMTDDDPIKSQLWRQPRK